MVQSQITVNDMPVYGQRFEDEGFVLEFARKKVDRSVRDRVIVQPALTSRRSNTTRKLYLIRCWAATVDGELRGFITSSYSGNRQWFGTYVAGSTHCYGSEGSVIGPEALV